MSQMEKLLYNGLNVMVIENHPNDSRATIRQDNTFQSLTNRMGTGGQRTYVN